MNVNKLKGKIVEKGMNIEKLAIDIGIDKATLYRKINNSDKFTIGDIKKITFALKLDQQEATEIFLS